MNNFELPVELKQKQDIAFGRIAELKQRLHDRHQAVRQAGQLAVETSNEQPGPVNIVEN